jgi:thiamine pyrophosphate-dependent enzyme
MLGRKAEAPQHGTSVLPLCSVAGILTAKAGGDIKMNGAESLVRTLVGGGVDVCFANPGTSEMHFVAALDRVDGMRCVLGLFEGVVTGAADGYYRMSDKPAATLLHLGPGLANGLANIHNANRRPRAWSTSSATMRPITGNTTRR